MCFMRPIVNSLSLLLSPPLHPLRRRRRSFMRCLRCARVTALPPAPHCIARILKLIFTASTSPSAISSSFSTPPPSRCYPPVHRIPAKPPPASPSTSQHSASCLPSFSYLLFLLRVAVKHPASVISAWRPTALLSTTQLQLLPPRTRSAPPTAPVG